MTPHEIAVVDAVKSVLTLDLLRPEYRIRPENPMFGHCFHASEALYYLLGGKAAGYRIRRAIDWSDVPHYWVISPTGENLDPTADQYYSIARLPPYDLAGRGAGIRRASRPRVR